MVHASKDQVTTADAGLSEAEAASHHVPLFPPARGLDGRDLAGSAPMQEKKALSSRGRGRTDCSMLGFPVLHYLLEFTQTHVH